MSAVPKLFSGREISDSAYRTLRTTIKESCGIDLGAEKKAFLIGRLQAILERDALKSFDDYCELLQGPLRHQMLSELIDRVTTNHTYFFRENSHFSHYQNVALKESIALSKQSSRRRLRVWCAASSSGQEPYTLAMLMMECLGSNYGLWDAGVLATDICNKVLDTAREGRYPSKDLEGMPSNLVTRYFDQESGGYHRVKQRVRDELLFRRLNLIKGAFPFRSLFDVVFCRNVMIYFDSDTKRDLVERIRRQIRLGGYLYIGAAESLPKGHRLQIVAPSVFRRVE